LIIPREFPWFSSRSHASPGTYAREQLPATRLLAISRSGRCRNRRPDPGLGSLQCLVWCRPPRRDGITTHNQRRIRYIRARPGGYAFTAASSSRTADGAGDSFKAAATFAHAKQVRAGGTIDGPYPRWWRWPVIQVGVPAFLAPWQHGVRNTCLTGVRRMGTAASRAPIS